MASQKPSSRRWRLLAGCLVLTGLLALGGAGTDPPLCKIYRVREGGRIVYTPELTNLCRGGRLTLPHPRQLQFSFAPLDETAEKPLRLRRKLEGVDPDWREAAGQMHVQVIARNESGQVLCCRSFTMAGESGGWTGAVETSEFHPRRESFILPAGIDRLEVLLIVQDWEILGIAAITDFRVLHRDASGNQENLWPDSKIEEGRNLDSPEGEPRYWTRGRIGANMARVSKLPPPARGHALVIADEELHISPNWQAELPLAGKVRAGDTLKLEWREAFSIGAGGRNHVFYDPPPPGEYVFRVQTVTAAGKPIGSSAALAISIPQAFWKRPPVIAVGLAAFALAIAVMIRTVTHRRLHARLDQAERHRRLELERLRIAQDIHDDLGASLTHISLLTQTAHEKTEQPHAAWEDLGRLRALTLNLTQKLDEIVWAVSPRHDTMESLVGYLTDLAEDFLGAAGIHTRLHFPMQLPSWTLPPGLRHNVFLAAKESLNNIVKHARATEAHLRLEILPDAFELTIEDNGCGFAPPSPPPSAGKRPARHGLGGVRERIESLGGRFSIDSAPGKGTRVVLTVPVNGIKA